MPVSTAANDAESARSAADAPAPPQPSTLPPAPAPVEIGGAPGPDPTRFGDWEKFGRCIDF
jgi:shikimate dehydrogenase